MRAGVAVRVWCWVFALSACATRPVAVTAPAPQRVAAPSVAPVEAAEARDDGDPPDSRREHFRGCSIAVPSYATRDEVEQGMRVLLATDTQETVALGLTMTGGGREVTDWAEFERGLRADITEHQHGELLLSHRPTSPSDAYECLWSQQMRVDRRERGRILARGRRWAGVTCSVSPTEFDAHAAECERATESLSLGVGEAQLPRPQVDTRWIGAQETWAQVPAGWFLQHPTNAIASVMEHHRPGAAIIELAGGELAVSVDDFVVGLRRNLSDGGGAVTTWRVQRLGALVKVDFEGSAVEERRGVVRQRVVVRGWRMCNAVCAGPDAFVRDAQSFCARWLTTLRVDR